MGEVADAVEHAPLVTAGDVLARALGGRGEHARVEVAVQLQDVSLTGTGRIALDAQ